MVLMLAQPASAASLTSSVEDPEGDAIWYVHKNQPTPGYLDIVGATITLEDGTFTLTMDMAADIPDEPALVKAAHVYWWEWAFDTGLGFWPIFPFGYTWEECAVIIAWDGKEWSADLYDWTSVQAWNDPVLKHSLQINGLGSNQLMVQVDSELMGEPEEFLWAAGTLGWMSPGAADTPSWAWWHFDAAGMDDVTGEWTPWPE